MKQAGLVAVVGALVLSVVGCGGNVTVDPTGGVGGSGGAGGVGGAGGAMTTTSTSSITTSTSSSTTTNPGTYCSYVCNQFEQYMCLEGGGVADCIKACADGFAQYPDCTDEIFGIYDCFVGQLPSSGCNGSDVCNAQAQAFTQCVDGGTTTCGETGCDISDGACSCEGECDGQIFDVNCKDTGNGVLCQCLINSEQVGTCIDANLSCDVFGGCCSGYFFSDG